MKQILALIFLTFLLSGCLSEVERCLKDNHPDELSEQQKQEVYESLRKIMKEELKSDKDFVKNRIDVAYKYEKENIAILACMDRFEYSEVGEASKNYFDTIKEYFF